MSTAGQSPQSSTNSQESPQTEAAHKTVSYWEKMGKLNLWSGILGVHQLRDNHVAHMKNREAEDAHVRKTVWGSEETGDEEPDDMGNTILGDVTYPAPVIVPQQPTTQPQQSNVAPMLAGMALGASLLGLPAAGILGYMLAQPDSTPEPAVESVEFADESVSIGLGRIEDYLKDQP